MFNQELSFDMSKVMNMEGMFSVRPLRVPPPCDSSLHSWVLPVCMLLAPPPPPVRLPVRMSSLPVRYTVAPHGLSPHIACALLLPRQNSLGCTTSSLSRRHPVTSRALATVKSSSVPVKSNSRLTLTLTPTPSP